MFAELRSYLAGWKEYFRPAETPHVFSDLDEWVRHRLRMVQLMQCKRGTTIYCEMKRLGATEDTASGWPPSCFTPRCPRATTTGWECRDLPGKPQPSEPPDTDPMSGGVAGDQRTTR